MKELTIENKELLLKDLCARLPYKVKGQAVSNGKIYRISSIISVSPSGESLLMLDNNNVDIVTLEQTKPYLRSMSNMTEEERKELNNQGYTKIAGELYHYCALSSNNAFYNPERHPYVRMEYVIKLIDWLNAHHFDYRGLIEKGLALEASKDMYK